MGSGDLLLARAELPAGLGELVPARPGEHPARTASIPRGRPRRRATRALGPPSPGVRLGMTGYSRNWKTDRLAGTGRVADWACAGSASGHDYLNISAANDIAGSLTGANDHMRQATLGHVGPFPLQRNGASGHI